MPCPSPRLFFFHTSVSRAYLPLLLRCLFIFSSCSFFIPLPSHPFYAYFIPLTLLRYLYPPSPSFSCFLPICDCVPFHSLLLNPPISSVTSPSPPLPDLLLLSSPPSFPSSLTFLRIPSYFPQLAPSAFPVSFPRLVFLCVSQPVCIVSHLSSSSRMSEFSEEPRFTIEQIDLLQRLRRTGMTKQEILHALDTLDRLDREHGDKFGRRTSSSSSSSSSYGVGGANSCTNNSASNTTTTTSFNNNNTASATTTSSASCNGGAINSGGEGGAADHATAATSSTTSKISTATQTQFNSAGGLSLSPSNSYDTSPPPGPPPPSAILPSPVSLVALTQNGRDSLAATPNGKLSPPRYPVNSAAATRAFGFESTEEDLDIDDKVEELMR